MDSGRFRRIGWMDRCAVLLVTSLDPSVNSVQKISEVMPCRY
jgi:hypothetical protein